MPAAMGKQTTLKQNAQKKLSMMVRKVAMLKDRKVMQSPSSERTKVTSAASTATCAPTPIAMPTSA
eukprot:CAMPEP_0180438562 /NCGR_PEP_ID=MMETSP1036_2-20121128/12133_1 /TAXON_ID=632150 /ORGANISM="Azadinium spinosum, Strain 3D9" /LENGTH=65 /DNA_ID=CAMNT_0022444667 /DNA_START=285 /DNA_END=482 /DNA_ORIENTATION=-